MAKEKMPYEIILDYVKRFEKLSDAKVLSELRAIPPLPDKNDAAWTQTFMNQVALKYVALWSAVAARRLREAIPLILDRACFGDPGEIMRGVCHALEAIVRPNWSELTPYCVAALQSERPGTRLWTAHQLGRVRDPDALPALEAAANDPEPEVRECAQLALECTREAAAEAIRTAKSQANKQQPLKKPQAKRKRSKS